MSTDIFNWENQKENLNSVARIEEYKVDERFYKIPKDKDGKSIAMVRFLPFVNKDMQVVPYIAYKQIGSKRILNGEIKWLIAKSPSSIDLPCPINEVYMTLMRSGDEAKQKLAKELFRPRLVHIANIQVIKDPVNPENEGQFRLFEFGLQVRQLFEKWNNPSQSEMKVQGIQKRNAFDPINGHDVILKLLKDASQPIPTWNNSEISPSPKVAIDGVDTVNKYVEFCQNNLVDLSEFLKPDWYPSYESLEEKLLTFYPDIKQITDSSSYSSPTKTVSADWGNVTEKEVAMPTESKPTSIAPVAPTAPQSDSDNLAWMD